MSRLSSVCCHSRRHFTPLHPHWPQTGTHTHAHNHSVKQQKAKALKNPSNRCRGSAKTEVESSPLPKKTDGSSSSPALHAVESCISKVCTLPALVAIRAPISVVSKDRIERADGVI